MKFILITYFLFVFQICNTLGDKPCAALPIGGESVVCVCDGDYCDEVTRSPPGSTEYVTYTSSKDGFRFYKTCGVLSNLSTESQALSSVLKLDPGIRYQNIEGFGGAATDAAGIQWASLPLPQRNFLVDSYFGSKGIEYNMIRVPIGGCDFSTRVYTYQDSPENDTMLSNFSLAYEDLCFKIPLIKSCMKAATNPVHILGSTWSPPIWMKSNHNITGISSLLPEYYCTYALYHSKFIKEYNKHGIPIWGLTTTNEPTNGLSIKFQINDLGWTAKAMGEYIVKYYGPLMRTEHQDVKILAVDDQRNDVPYYFNEVIKHDPAALNYIDGIAVHWYSDFNTNPLNLSQVAEQYPDKFILATEACSGFDSDDKVVLGSWDRARKQILDIMEDINHYVTGWIDWNLFLDTEGGPNWIDNYVDSPIIVDAKKGIFYKQPTFYALGHFSKFVPRGSVRIGVSSGCSVVSEVAVLTPQGSIVVVMYNDSNSTTSVTVRDGAREAILDLEPNSITTLEFLCEE